MLHPLRCSHSPDLFEGCIQCAVITETAVVGQLLGAYWLMSCDSLMVKVNEVLDAQTIDVSIVSDSLQSKVFAEVGTVDANQCGELGKRDVVL